MEENKGIKISVSTFFLLIAIIVIIIMGFFMYKIYNDKEKATSKIEELNTQTDNLQSTIENLQGKLDSISSTINNTTTIDTSNKTTETETDKEEVENTVDKDTTITESKKILFEYTSGDNNATKGNPEVLKVYEFNDSQMIFEYHAAWNPNDINGTAKKIEDDTYIYEMNDIKIEFVLNAEGNNSVKVTEYKNGEMSSYVNLWK